MSGSACVFVFLCVTVARVFFSLCVIVVRVFSSACVFLSVCVFLFENPREEVFLPGGSPVFPPTWGWWVVPTDGRCGRVKPLALYGGVKDPFLGFSVN